MNPPAPRAGRTSDTQENSKGDPMTDPIHPDPARRDPVSRPAVPAGDASLQDQIHAVRANRTEARTGRRGTSKLVAGGAVLAAIVALWQFGPRFGWGPGGRGPGNGQGGTDRMGVVDDSNARTASSSQRPQQPAQRPLRVQIDGNRYLVDNKEVDLPTLTRMASQVPAGDGPAVEVKRTESSRVKAEQDLKAALEKNNLSTTWMPPLE